MHSVGYGDAIPDWKHFLLVTNLTRVLRASADNSSNPPGRPLFVGTDVTVRELFARPQQHSVHGCVMVHHQRLNEAVSWF
jgi:hypothetical protein